MGGEGQGTGGAPGTKHSGMNPPAFPRLLVMGCSRSGTTLLQSLLANHSRIFTFPETGVFLRAFGMRGGVLPWVHLGLTAGKERRALRALAAVLGGAPGRSRMPPLPKRRLSLAGSLSDVIAYFDSLAKAQGKDIWLEKTPRHVLHAERIGAVVPESLCIHMVRNGSDVVASIVDRAKRYPDRFPRQGDPSYGIRQWNQSLRATAQAIRRPGHVVVFYDALVSETEATLQALCEIIGIDFQEGMTVPGDPGEFIQPEEGWKSQVAGGIKPADSKFEKLFDLVTRSRILGGLEEEAYEEMKNARAGSPGKLVYSGTGGGGAG